MLTERYIAGEEKQRLSYIFSITHSTLTGIITDWSDQQFNGLAEVVGNEVAEEVVKGCRVSPDI